MKDLKTFEREVNREARRWDIEKEILNKKISVEEEKEKYKQKRRKKISTSKLLILFLFINCTLIEIFTGIITWKMVTIGLMMGMGIDLGPLVALIGAVVSEVIGYSIYSLKSIKENTKGGIVYESAFQNQNNLNE